MKIDFANQNLAGVAKRPNAADCKSAGIFPSGVRIPLPAPFSVDHHLVNYGGLATLLRDEKPIRRYVIIFEQFDMVERLLIQPTKIVETTSPVIFLAGPIQGAPDWQSRAAEIIHNSDASITVASPRRAHPEDTFIYEKQVDWETHFLRRAGRLGVIGFWLAAQTEETPGRAYAQTSRFELGEWKVRHEYEQTKLALGIEDGFGNASYIRRRFNQDCPDIQIVDSLEEMCRNAIDLVSKA